MKGILHLVSSDALDDRWRWVHHVRPVIAWQPWPWELARDWLNLDQPPAPPALPENVRLLLKAAAPSSIFAETEQFRREPSISPKGRHNEGCC
ncbi:hypothetical protein [Streptomyces phaeoluteigriseus]